MLLHTFVFGTLLWCLIDFLCKSAPFWPFFSSPETKAQVSFSDQNLSVVCRRCCHCPRCWHWYELFTFSSSSPNNWANFNQTWHKASLGEGDSIYFSYEGARLFPRGDNYKIGKIHWWNLKTTGPISTKFGTKYYWFKGIRLLFKLRTIQFS